MNLICSRTVPLIVALCIALLGALGCNHRQTVETLTLAENLAPISGVTIVAQKKGFFAARGLDVKVAEFTSGKQCLETVVGKGADIATAAEAPTTAAAMALEDIAVLARTEFSYLKTLTATRAAIRSAADLKGKRLAYTAGTGGELYTLRLLKSAGLTKDDVSLVNLRPEDMGTALANGSIDAYDTWEPHVLNGQRALGDGARLLDTRGVYSETFNIVTRKELVASRRAALSAFVQALLDAETWIGEHRDDAIALVAGAVGMPAQSLGAIWDDYTYHVVLDQKTIDALDAYTAFRLESGNHPPNATRPDWHAVVTPEVLRDVDPGRIQLAGY